MGSEQVIRSYNSLPQKSPLYDLLAEIVPADSQEEQGQGILLNAMSSLPELNLYKLSACILILPRTSDLDTCQLEDTCVL